MLRWFEHNQIYHPDRNLKATGAELGRLYQDVFFCAADGVKLHGWFYPSDPDLPRRRLALLFCHGNAGNISHRLHTCEAILATGVNVFIFDYRGYGRSHGWPSEEGTYHDAHAAFQWLRDKGFAAEDIIAFGESLGGGIASDLARREPLGGLVLQSSFTSIPDLGGEWFPWLPVRSFATVHYDTCARLPCLKMPVLIMHSRVDGLIPFRHAERNFAAANEPKLLWELKGHHNEPLADRDLFVSGLDKFLRMVSLETQA
jgi:fermentation-respiration switch protein FrsA (DUF1100 family)